MNVSKLAYLWRMMTLLPLYQKYRDFTMIRRLPYVENLVLMSLALDNNALDGLSVIECGTWKGGMSAGMIEVGGSDRTYYFFDSFEGLPPAQEIDGESAIEWQSKKHSPEYFDNCTAAIDDFWRAVDRSGCDRGKIHPVKGFFQESLPSFESPQIAILRLDGDWYESTMVCLEKFWDFVVPGGIILIDDYGTWDGCTRAIHDFLSSRKACEFVQQGPLGRVVYIRKRAAARL